MKVESDQVEQAEWQALCQWQEELENVSFSQGAEAFRSRLNKANARGAGASLGGSHRLMREAFGRLEEGIAAAARIPEKASAEHIADRWYRMAGPDVVAYLALKRILSYCAQAGPRSMRGTVVRNPEASLGMLATDLWLDIRDELRYRRFREKYPAFFKYKMQKFMTNSYTHMSRSMNASIRFTELDVSDLDLPGHSGMRVGLQCIDLVIRFTGLVEKVHGVYRVRGKTRKYSELAYTAATEEWIHQYNANAELLQPRRMPMVVPPLPWSPQEKGGYRYGLRDRFPLLRKGSPAANKRIQQLEIPTVFTAVNLVQGTAWKVNTRMLDVIQMLRNAGGGIAGLIQRDDTPLPAKPPKIDEDRAVRREWKKAAASVKDHNVRRRANWQVEALLLDVAERLRKAPAIYFPHSMDFRGRLYPLATHLTPQGGDLSKSLLTFAEGKPLTKDGMKWLAIHGAGLLGTTPGGEKVSQMTLEERSAWVMAHSAMIVAAAKDPLAETWWRAADDPLRFLAFCLEWSDLLEQGPSFRSCLPCSMDGSCNGLQHFAALLRDEVGGAAVNLIPSTRPRDVYRQVSEAVLIKMEKKAAHGNREALQWLGLHNRLGLIDRKLVKSPTMTFGYGSKQYGFRDQIHEYLKGLDSWPDIQKTFSGDGPLGSGVSAAVGLMGSLIWSTLGDIVVAAFGGMAWIQQTASGITSQNKPVQWTVPLTGFPVEQQYQHYNLRRVVTMLAGSLVSPSVREHTTDVNSRKQAAAMAPNLIHSLDAAALHLTVEMAEQAGVSQFAMVHDSFGTVAADCATLAWACREAFVRLYTEVNVVEDLHQQLSQQWERAADCPTPPPMGTLNVEDVRQSLYFFA